MRIVSGGEWEAGFVSLFSPDKTYVYTQANSVIAPWITEKDVHDCGMVMLNPTKLQLEHFSAAKVQEAIQIKNEKNNSNTQLELAISPPKGECQLK
jgi:CRISPR/Cas system-associated protein Cas7 (RAMP superfamily)